ncbi:MAG: DUF5610 domain-containing protein [Gammaproteobacteria bacterium]|nr:DUF5610 domain-containing protein [Gammaproteobacteria bacterium]
MDIQAFGQKISQLAQSEDKKVDGPFGQTVSDLAHQKKQLNAAILQSNANVSLSTGNESLALLYKTAIEGINQALQDTMGDNAIQATYDAGIDVSPEATADRIVSQSTAFFSAYSKQHPELNLDDALVKFTDLIKGGIDKGFSEARAILDGLQVLEGDIASNIDKTYELVQTGLVAFIEHYNHDKSDTTTTA